jgi:basic membrane protein A
MTKKIVLLFMALVSLNKVFSEETRPHEKFTVRLVMLLYDKGDVFVENAFVDIINNHKNYLHDNSIDYDVIYIESSDTAGIINSLGDITAEHYDLIISVGFRLWDAVRELAGKNPRQKYLIIDGDSVDLPNVMEIIFAEHEGSFLVGALAALKAVENEIVYPQFGFIGGLNNEITNAFEIGYVQGVLSILPDARFVDAYVDRWDAPSAARSIAARWYGFGVFAVFAVAGAGNQGVISAAQEYRAAGRDVWAIGVDIDQFEGGVYTDASHSTVLTSMVKNVSAGVVFCVDSILAGNFTGGLKTLTLADNGIGYTRTNQAVSENITAYLKYLESRIINGEIIVYNNYRQARTDPRFPAYLKCSGGY